MDKSLSGHRILLVEDEMLNIAMLEDILTEAGCESVAAAATIDQAIALIDEQVFDAALLDIKLKGKACLRRGRRASRPRGAIHFRHRQ